MPTVIRAVCLVLVFASMAQAQPRFSILPLPAPTFSAPRVSFTDDQSSVPHRARLSTTSPSELPPGAPTIQIQFPTDQLTWTTTATKQRLAGVAAGQGSGCQIAIITWTNNQGPQAGTALGTCNWEIPETSAAGDLVVCIDEFNEAAGTTLEAHTPPCANASWVKRISQASNNLRVNALNDYVWPNNDDLSGTALTIYQALSDLSGANYDVNVTVKAQNSTQLDTMAGAVIGYASISQYCGVAWIGSDANPDLFFVRTTGGTPAVLETANVDVVVGSIITVQARGSNFTVLHGAATVLSLADATCGAANGVGLVWGNLDGAGRNIKTTQALDTFTITQIGADVEGLDLAVGSNLITVTACDTATPQLCSADIITITREGADSIAPVITIDTPNPPPFFDTSTAGPHTFAGPCTDAVGCTSFTGVYNGGAPITGTLTGAPPNQRWQVIVPTVVEGNHDLVVDGTDAQNNNATAQTITIRASLTDTTRPNCTIVTPADGTTHTVGTITLTGTCADANTITASRWSNSRAGSGSCTGTTAPQCQVVLVEGTGNRIDLYATDNSGNESEAQSPGCTAIGPAQKAGCITVTLNVPIQVVTQTALPPATDGTAYTCFQMTTSGHFGAVTWTNNGAGTTLNDSDPNCAGFTMTTGGLVCHPLTSYDRTGANPDICNWVSKPTDAMADTTTKAHTIQINDSVGEGRDAFFNNINATLPVCTANNKGTPCVSASVHLSNQATINAATNAPLLGPDPVNNDYITYNATNGFAEIRMPLFSLKPDGTQMITNRVWGFGGTQGPWPAAVAGAQSCVQVKNDQISDTSDWAFVVGDYPNGTYEIVKRITNANCPQIKGTGTNPSQMNVVRGVGGTTPQPWPLETILTIATKKLGTHNQLELSIGALNVDCGADLDCTLPDTDGIVYPDDGCGVVGCSTYLIMWDFMWDETSRMGPGGGSVGFQWPPPKTYNIQTLGPVENFALPQIAGRVCTRADNVTPIPGCDLDVQVAARVNLRHSANGTSGGFADWSISNGKMYCSKADCVPPHVGSDHGITPQIADQPVYPNVIYRAYVFIEAKFDDYDRTTYWLASQTTGVNPVLIQEDLKLSLSPDEGCRASGCTPHSAPNRLSVFELEYDISAYGAYGGRDLVNNVTLAPGADGLIDPMVSWFNNFQVIRGLTKAAAFSTYINCGASCKPVP